MKHRTMLSAVTLASTVVMIGCASTPKTPTVAVRFTPVPMEYRFDGTGVTSRLASSEPSDPADPYLAYSPGAYPVDAFTVALWGGNYYGQNVALRQAQLEPGNYTFGFWDHDRNNAFKGWVEVNFTSNDLIEVLKEWKSRIPQQKQWLAFDYHLNSRCYAHHHNHDVCHDVTHFKSFSQQLRAFDKLERELDRAIAHEWKMREQNQNQFNNFFNTSVLAMLPTGDEMFHPTTQPVFMPVDMKSATDGRPVTKYLVAADVKDVQQKLHLVDRVSRHLSGCRSALYEEIERLERRRRYYATTDHIYNHDHRFVTNEMRIQQTLNAIDQLNEEIVEMRDHRLALAFTSGLVSPDRFFDPLDTEQRDLAMERTVLETRKNRLDNLYSAADENGPRKVVFDRQRQRVNRAIEDIDRYVGAIDEARVALTTMREATRVVHRQGDMRLLASTFVDESVPSRVRNAVADFAFMTVRIESAPSWMQPNDELESQKARTASYRYPDN